MDFYDWMLSLHVLGAFMFVLYPLVAAAVVVGFLGLKPRARPDTAGRPAW